MFSETDLLTWWNKPICILFAILLLPFGIFLYALRAIPVLIRNPKYFLQLNHWSIFTPGFHIGLIVSFIIIGPIVALSFNIKRVVKDYFYNKGVVGKQHKEIVENISNMLQQVRIHILEKTKEKSIINVMYDKMDRVTRVHLLYGDKGNIIVFIPKEKNKISCNGRYYDINKLDFEKIKDDICTNIKEMV